MKFKIDNSVITLISIIGMDIIMYSWIVNLFFEKDPTIIAGIIAFVGAVIGGYLTWSGVVKNIEFEKERDELRLIPEKISNINILLEKVENAQNTRVKLLSNNSVLNAMGDKKDSINHAILVNYNVYIGTKNLYEVIKKEEKIIRDLILHSAPSIANDFIRLHELSIVNELKEYKKLLINELDKLEDKIY
ncbi:hypothetical protein ACQKNB_00970 [Lysinibacillus xylanilyticus]|uniref:hypothetical protein n=1 Tax=Lysinibacillus xylanilyticus TaxID=582475 RepID=UPI003D03CBC6